MDQPTPTYSEPVTNMPTHHGAKMWLFGVGLLVGLLVGIGGYYLWSHRTSIGAYIANGGHVDNGPTCSSACVIRDNSASPADVSGYTTTGSEPAVVVPDGWQTVVNAGGHYSFSYPKDWQRLAKFETVATQTAVASPATIAAIASAGATEVSPDLLITYYDSAKDLTAIDAKGNQVQGFGSLGDYLTKVHEANVTNTGTTRNASVGVYIGFYTEELPGFGSTDYMLELNKHVYDIRFDPSQQTMVDQILTTFRATK